VSYSTGRSAARIDIDKLASIADYGGIVHTDDQRSLLSTRRRHFLSFSLPFSFVITMTATSPPLKSAGVLASLPLAVARNSSPFSTLKIPD
jgi:hypothetical protein